MEVAAIKT